jgi:hypothetical protein
MKILRATVNLCGIVLAWTSEFGAFFFGLLKYAQGSTLWLAIGWGALMGTALTLSGLLLMCLAQIGQRQPYHYTTH